MSSVKTVFASIASYLTSPAFNAMVVGMVIVIALVVVLYRVAVRLVPRISMGRKPED